MSLQRLDLVNFYHVLHAYALDLPLPSVHQNIHSYTGSGCWLHYSDHLQRHKIRQTVADIVRGNRPPSPVD